jgi:hypothetical protein
MNTFAPPPGKVFILEHVGFNDPWASPRQITVFNTFFTPAGGTSTATTLVYPANFNTLTRPLKVIGSTMSIQCDDRSAPNQWVILYGLLVDVADLYAGISSEIEGFAKAGAGPATGEIHLSSSRPSLVSVQQSTDLAAWSPSGAVVSSSKSPAVKDFEFSPPPGDPKRFFRAAARARETD